MNELADWGRPAPPEWSEPRQHVDIRLPSNLVRVLRSRARTENVSLSIVVERFVREAMHLTPAGREFVD